MIKQVHLVGGSLSSECLGDSDLRNSILYSSKDLHLLPSAMSGQKGKRKVVVYKDDRFVNDEASVSYDLVKPKPVIFEQRFEMEMKYWSKGYFDNMQKQGWSTFCHPRTGVILPWVYEFYANGKFQNDDKVLVRGKEVNFSRQVICECFDMENPEWDDYEQIKNTVSPD
ncbi:hypothetical protein KSP40_PGU005445 [Platanthera guangdongensis]|uniref:Uncharacterized protein n=1 Tax=Platanthera guangdongensis TaxID=2320717 RepID=A0ABR2LFC3_9ASPA